MKIKYLLITTLILIIGCASTVKAPKWFNKPPSKKGYKYAVGTDISDRRQSALVQARDVALADLAKQLEAESETVNDQVLEEVADNTAVNVWTSSQKTMVAKTLRDYREVQSDVKKSGRKYEAFVLIELNLVASQERMLAELEKDAEVMKKLRKSELIQEMEVDIEAYRKRRGY